MTEGATATRTVKEAMAVENFMFGSFAEELLFRLKGWLELVLRHEETQSTFQLVTETCGDCQRLTEHH
jgi:hypothetical protein